MRAKALAAVAVVGVLLVAGCASFGGRNCDISPGDFACQFGGTGNLDESESWENPSSTAELTVQLGGSGEITVTLLDADGQQVLQETVSAESGGAQETRTSSAGASGQWTVQIQGNYSGGLQVKVESG